ncbi:MAG: alpha/beta hydrolase [Micrococcales bacterium]|nr:alpha/beta hydrolase [Micrococcales bacterium]
MARICGEITGRYVYLTVQGVEYRVYFEEAGQGLPVLCFHTAGSDGRQWRHLLEDPALLDEFRFVAPDLPFHGKSLPPTSEAWWSRRYSLNEAFLLDFVKELAAALELDGGVYIGCSMGGHLAPDIALHLPGLFRAALAIQGGLATHDPEPFNKYLSHPRTSNESKAALMLGQTSPRSPEALRRETGWVYAQGGPQVFQGDLDYYLGEHDISQTAKDIDTTKTEVHVLAGVYDWSATPERARGLAEATPGATYTCMEGLGHFPMSESPDEFKRYVIPLLRRIAQDQGQ